MQEFYSSQLDERTCNVMGYKGDEARVVIPRQLAGKDVTILFDGLFKYHDEITYLKIPSTVTNIGSYMFEGCTGLKEIKLPDSLKEIWENAFARSSIREIVIPDGVTTIMPYTFRDCKELRKVVLGKGVRKVCQGAFEGCDKLKEVVNNSGVKIGPEAYDSGVPEFSVHDEAVHTKGYDQVGKK